MYLILSVLPCHEVMHVILRSHASALTLRRILSLSLRYLHPKNLIGLDMSGMAMLAKEVWIELH